MSITNHTRHHKITCVHVVSPFDGNERIQLKGFFNVQAKPQPTTETKCQKILLLMKQQVIQ